MDDPLTMLHLFAVLPADSTHKIPVNVVQSARRLSLEFQAFVTRVHALRKVFVAVKGIYYQAEVGGQKITWLTPHVLSQILPDDVDFRVMLTFVEFYETLAGFVNFKLYHDLGLTYPPLLNSRLESEAAELYGVLKDLAAEQPMIAEVGQSDQPRIESPAVEELDESGGVSSEALPKDFTPEQREKRIVESQKRLASLQDKLSAIEDNKLKSEAEEYGHLGTAKVEEAEAVDDNEDTETRKCRSLFKGLKFFLGREVPRESLLFVIRAFGGDVSWDGLAAPFPETDEDISYQVVDRPTQSHMFLSRIYVQPQWIYDSANALIFLPTDSYLLGKIPPPHLSPFADNDAEGYMPEYAETIKRLKHASEKHVLPLPGTEDEIDDTRQLEAAAAIHRSQLAEVAKDLEAAAVEIAYREDLTKEIAGVRYSEALQAGTNGTDMSEDEEAPPQGPQITALAARPLNEDIAMAQAMMPRKTRKLYEAMQMGNAKKTAKIELLKERKRKAEENREQVKKRKGRKP
eukprot:TRINITY_DN7891_c0_g1_i1.p1 TRINITY_DN7891_c0_g1~~TRINITY_DN7891_c0_g1_i1.p1  ORF type:complete len:548 (+),score=126.02 TRINITY_DN7891_c0_g1_i1:94-1644(+)